MNKNKLKHEFVKKEKNGFNTDVVVNYETSPFREVGIQRTYFMETKNVEELNILNEHVKKEMILELAELLYENGFIRTCDVTTLSEGTTKVIMKMKVQKLI
jgi:hypothetical protein